MEYLWLMLAVIGLPVLLLFRALRRLNDEPPAGTRREIYQGQVQQAIRRNKAPQPSPQPPAETEALPVPPPVPARETPPHPQPTPKILPKSGPARRRALIQALLLSEILRPRSK